MAKQINQILSLRAEQFTLSEAEVRSDHGQATSTHQPTKTMENHFSPSSLSRGRGIEGEGKSVAEQSRSVDYNHALLYLQSQGVKYFGSHFKLHESDKPLLRKLLCYFLKDETTASNLGVNLNKGILLTGPVGCGKTSLMFLMRFFLPFENRYIVRSCRDISFEFIKDGYPIISKYSHFSFKNSAPLTYCFDDLGTENNLKHYGNECNIMAEILLSRYDLFISRKLLTHITTNLSASEMEALYGNRVRSRMREMFNLVAFNKSEKDKRC